MSYSFKKIILSVFSCGFCLIGCTQTSLKPQSVLDQTSLSTASQNQGKTLDLMVSIAPQKYFAQKIGADRIQVNVMVDPTIEPEIYEPKTQQLTALTETEAYVSIGLPFEDKWLDKFKNVNPKMSIINSDHKINFLEMSEHDHGHDHGEIKENGAYLDPHIWLSPSLVKTQAQNIYEGLKQIDPDNEQFYRQNLDQFLLEINQLDQQIRANLAGVKNRKFIVFHPAWTYFAHEYNLEQIPVQVDGQEPSAAELAKLITTAKNEQIKVIFVQPEFKTKNAETIAQEINGKVIMINPNDPNWAENLLNVSEIFKENL